MSFCDVCNSELLIFGVYINRPVAFHDQSTLSLSHLISTRDFKTLFRLCAMKLKFLGVCVATVSMLSDVTLRIFGLYTVGIIMPFVFMLDLLYIPRFQVVNRVALDLAVDNSSRRSDARFSRSYVAFYELSGGREFIYRLPFSCDFS